MIENYIVDFYCTKAKLVIELDGSQHYESKGLLNDKIRTAQIEKHDLMVIRIPNSEVLSNFKGVCDYIDNIVKDKIY